MRMRVACCVLMRVRVACCVMMRMRVACCVLMHPRHSKLRSLAHVSEHVGVTVLAACKNVVIESCWLPQQLRIRIRFCWHVLKRGAVPVHIRGPAHSRAF